MPDDSFAIHAYVSDQAKAAYENYSLDNGVSVTGMLEALGLELSEEIDTRGSAEGLRPDWARSARRIDAIRRRRDGTRRTGQR